MTVDMGGSITFHRPMVRWSSLPLRAMLLVILLVPPAIAWTQPRWLTDAAADTVAFLEHKPATSIVLFEACDIRIDDHGYA